MWTRRDLARSIAAAAAGVALGGEAAYAQKRKIKGDHPEGLVYLNANENPDGPPPSSIAAMTAVLSKSGRYHDEDNDRFTGDLARLEGLSPDQVLTGSGSSEILHCAVDAFTSAARPLITSAPAYELPVDLANAAGRPVIQLPMTPTYAADVRGLVREAENAKGGFIYVVNPNNPTSTITPKEDIAWLIGNLPPNTVAMIDEAYIHFSTAPDLASAMPYVRSGKNVVIAKTFSKIYGMAGLRVGYGCGRADLISKMNAYRNNVISVTGLFAAKAAIAEAQTLVPARREKLVATRDGLCSWLDAHKIAFIPPHANFVMIDVNRDVRGVISDMMERGVAVGRPFPPMTQFLRVSIGSEAEVARFKQEFAKVMKV